MKIFSNTICCLAAALFLLSMQNFKPRKVIFFGDSITAAGVKPDGYITLMQQNLKEKGQEKNFELIGAGVSGNKISDLFLRFEDDVFSKQPDVVVIYIGINDIWHKRTSQTGTDAPKFENFYAAMIKKLQANGVQVVLCTPSVIGEKTDFSNEQDGDLNQYSKIIRNLTTAYNCKLCDLRKAFLEYNLKNNPQNKEAGILTTDRVHLNVEGNKLVANLLFPLII